MKKILTCWAICFIAVVCQVAFYGCSSPVKFDKITEEDARKIAQYIKLQEGLIQNGVASATQLAIYHIPEGSDKSPIINIVHVISSNISSAIDSGQTDPDSIRACFKIKEPYYDNIFEGIGLLVNAKIQDLKKNGYGDLSIAILSATLKGLKDGTAIND